MARQISLREFQQGLAQRLREAQTEAEPTSRLGVQAGSGNWLLTQGHDGGAPRVPWLTINNVLGVLRACQRGIGITMLPDYLVEENGGLVELFCDTSDLAYDC